MRPTVPRSPSDFRDPPIVGGLGGVAMTLLLVVEYGQLFGPSPLAAPLLTEPLPLLVGPVLIGGALTALLGGRVDRYEGLALVVPHAALPAVAVFPFALGTGVLTAFGPTGSVESVGHFVVGLFFVSFYAGVGMALSTAVFVVTFVGASVGTLLVGLVTRRVADRI